MPKRTHDGLVKDCGCAEKNWTRCAHSWAVRFHANGKAHFVALHKYADWPRGKAMPKTEALRLRDKIRGEIRDGVLAARQAPVGVTTVAAVIAAYREQFVDVPSRRPHAKVSMGGHLDMVARLKVAARQGGRCASTRWRCGR